MRTELPVTARITSLREIYRACPVATLMAGQKRPKFYAWSRYQTLYFLEGWEKYSNEPTSVLRRARAEAEVLLRSRPIIEAGELVTGQPDFLPFTPEEQTRFDALYEAFNAQAPLQEGRYDHLALNYDRLLRLGVNGIMEEIRERMRLLGPDTPENVTDHTEKREFYTGCLIELEALLDYAARYAARARSLAQETADPLRRREMTELAEVLDRVPAGPARSFREAVQSVHFYTFSLWG